MTGTIATLDKLGRNVRLAQTKETTDSVSVA